MNLEKNAEIAAAPSSAQLGRGGHVLATSSMPKISLSSVEFSEKIQPEGFSPSRAAPRTGAANAGGAWAPPILGCVPVFQHLGFRLPLACTTAECEKVSGRSFQLSVDLMWGGVQFAKIMGKFSPCCYELLQFLARWGCKSRFRVCIVAFCK